MTKRDLAMLISRVLAVLALFNAVFYAINFLGMLPFIATNFNQLSSATSMAPYLLHAFIALVFINMAYFLWFHAERFAYWLTRGMTNEKIAEAQQTYEWQALLIAALGLYLIGTCSTDISRLLATLWGYQAPQTNATILEIRLYAFILMAFRFLLGLFLVLRCRMITARILGNSLSYPLPGESKAQEGNDSNV